MILYILFGVVFGIVGGMGLGGGIVLIPCLTLFMAVSQHSAQGMTLFAYIPMAVFALISHIKQKNVRLKSALFVMIFGGFGGAAGYFLVSVIKADSLKIVFAVFLIIVALLRIYRQEIAPKLKDKKKDA